MDIKESAWSEKLVRMKIEQFRKPRIKTKVSELKLYCEICREVLKAPREELLKEEKKGNIQSSFVDFILNPNIDFIVEDPYNKLDNLKIEDLKNTGKRVLATIVYAWGYYIRLLKELESKTKSIVFSEGSVNSAKENISKMLQQLQDKRYNWELYHKEEIINQQQLEKEVKDEQGFVNLLDNMLKTQMNKVLKARNKGIELEPMPVRTPVGPQEGQEVPKQVEQRPQKPGLDKLIDVRQYFEGKKKRMQQKVTANDPISALEQRRRFNASVIRFMMSNTQAQV